MKFTLINLGCPKNTVDGLGIIATLERDGFVFSGDISECEVAVVNTCGFIDAAKRESIEQILEVCALKTDNENPLHTVAVCGCLAERYFDDIKEDLAEVDVVCGLGSTASLGELIRDKVSSKGEKLDADFGERNPDYEGYSSYIKISDGCDNCCSYCAIPSIRGRYRSRAKEDIIVEISGLAAVGVSEFTIVAQDTTAYGFDLYEKYRLHNLLQDVEKIDGVKRVFVLYAYPERITDELIATIRDSKVIAKYLDLPIQHIDDDILHKMSRPMREAQFGVLFKKLREIPGMVLRTTLIAGFPTETEEQFDKLCEFVKNAKFEHLGAFAYSQEEGTSAAKMDGQIPEEVKQRRAEIIEEIQHVVFEEKLNARVGTVENVLVEGFDKYAEVWFGRSGFDAPEIDGKVFFRASSEIKVGDYVDVKIEEIIDFNAFGEVVL